MPTSTFALFHGLNMPLFDSIQQNNTQLWKVISHSVGKTTPWLPELQSFYST
jgi:hypothetical protein